MLQEGVYSALFSHLSFAKVWTRGDDSATFVPQSYGQKGFSGMYGEFVFAIPCDLPLMWCDAINVAMLTPLTCSSLSRLSKSPHTLHQRLV